LLPHAGGSVFRLVRIAMIRALALNSGKPSLIGNTSSEKATTLALEEISQGKIVLVNKKLHQEKKGE